MRPGWRRGRGTELQHLGRSDPRRPLCYPSRTPQRLLDAGCKETIKVCYLVVQIEDLASGFNEPSQNRAGQVHRKDEGLPTVDAMLWLQVVNEAVKRNRARPVVV